MLILSHAMYDPVQVVHRILQLLPAVIFQWVHSSAVNCELYCAVHTKETNVVLEKVYTFREKGSVV